MGSQLHHSAACAIIFGLLNFGIASITHLLSDLPAEIASHLVRECVELTAT
eukprot:NODE_12294_length_263_cov_223.187500.p2 GENE.NODE_12294_length_263_cov_223.187500~~NODE_12294_length_263_cov_223.187500.p2  ORF type:complete len:58 (+),score=23.15 NODE_12294_length_263_cov_223.187500:22-174(+)